MEPNSPITDTMASSATYSHDKGYDPLWYWYSSKALFHPFLVATQQNTRQRQTSATLLQNTFISSFEYQNNYSVWCCVHRLNTWEWKGNVGFCLKYKDRSSKQFRCCWMHKTQSMVTRQSSMCLQYCTLQRRLSTQQNEIKDGGVEDWTLHDMNSYSKTTKPDLGLNAIIAPVLRMRNKSHARAFLGHASGVVFHRLFARSG